jgi:hypothetical protein
MVRPKSEVYSLESENGGVNGELISQAVMLIEDTFKKPSIAGYVSAFRRSPLPLSRIGKLACAKRQEPAAHCAACQVLSIESPMGQGWSSFVLPTLGSLATCFWNLCRRRSMFPSEERQAVTCGLRSAMPTLPC